jgi:hypothetical protein
MRQYMQDHFQPLTTPPRGESRHGVELRLAAVPGRHLVFVHYAPDHLFHWEWIYNGADIDSAKIVWSRQIDPQSDAAFQRYLAADHVWQLEPDTTPPTLRALPR